MAAGDLGARAPVAGGDEVGRLGESFNGMAARVETTVTSLRRFVADAAHEIGTPLTALQADLELAERKATSDDERRLVDRALAQTARLAGLSDNLLQLSRLEAGEPAGERAERGPRRRGARAGRRRGLARGAGRRRAGARRRRRPPPRPARPRPPADGPRQPARQRRQVHAGGRQRRLAVRREGGEAVATVADTGVGIPADEQRADLRALPPRPQRLGLPRQRPGPRDREGGGGARRRHGLVHELGGRHHLPRSACRSPRTPARPPRPGAARRRPSGAAGTRAGALRRPARRRSAAPRPVRRGSARVRAATAGTGSAAAPAPCA